eukprot:7379927-Prymnesium_polylepis.3
MFDLIFFTDPWLSYESSKTASHMRRTTSLSVGRSAYGEVSARSRSAAAWCGVRSTSAEGDQDMSGVCCCTRAGCRRLTPNSGGDGGGATSPPKW